jgi:rare lipoprotein A (peptidoglycan hydrolase)
MKHPYKNVFWHACRVFLLAAVFLWSRALQAPPPASSSQPLEHEIAGIPTSPALATPNSQLKPKAMKIWDGIAGWYGDQFDGRPTATGETYDMYAETAAHKTLPLGSIVRVVNLRTMQSDIVRINDRGPFVEGRDLDVSYAVAERLGIVHNGVARVRIELLEVPKRLSLIHPQD